MTRCLPLRRIELVEIGHERRTLRNLCRERQAFARLLRDRSCYDGGVSRYDDLVVELKREFPGMRIVRKDQSAMHRAIHVFLKVVTLGRMNDYLESYQTTIGKTIYVTSDWDQLSVEYRFCTLRHEAVHLRQFRKWTLPGMSIAYVLLPLPMGLAWFRAYFEKEAYAESIRSAIEVYGRAHVDRPQFRNSIIEQFVSPSYGWMWPFRRSMERWYDRVLQGLDAGG